METVDRTTPTNKATSMRSVYESLRETQALLEEHNVRLDQVLGNDEHPISDREKSESPPLITIDGIQDLAYTIARQVSDAHKKFSNISGN